MLSRIESRRDYDFGWKRKGRDDPVVAGLENPIKPASGGFNTEEKGIADR
jgi:hypothetical protein